MDWEKQLQAFDGVDNGLLVEMLLSFKRPSSMDLVPWAKFRAGESETALSPGPPAACSLTVVAITNAMQR